MLAVEGKKSFGGRGLECLPEIEDAKEQNKETGPKWKHARPWARPNLDRINGDRKNNEEDTEKDNDGGCKQVSMTKREIFFHTV